MSQPQNLLTSHWQRRMLIVGRLRLWCLVWVIAATLAGIACAGKFSLNQTRVLQLEKLNEEATPLYQVALETTKSERELGQLEGRESLLATLDSSNHPFLLLGIVSKSAANIVGQLSIDSFDLQTSSRSQAVAAKTKSTPFGRKARRKKASSLQGQDAAREEIQLLLKGTASNDLVISQFVSRLRDHGVFDSVVLYSSLEDAQQGRKLFHVGCNYIK